MPMAKLGGGGESATSNILVICPTHRDYRELPLLSTPATTSLSHDYARASLEDLISKTTPDGELAADPLAEIDRILATIDGMKVAAVISTDDYPGSALPA